MIAVRQSPRDGEVIVEFTGVFDLQAARELIEVAALQPLGLGLVIDVSRSSSVHDSALGLLVDRIPRSRSRVIVAMNTHQQKLLVLLGEAAFQRPKPALAKPATELNRFDPDPDA